MDATRSWLHMRETDCHHHHHRSCLWETKSPANNEDGSKHTEGGEKILIFNLLLAFSRRIRTRLHMVPALIFISNRLNLSESSASKHWSIPHLARANSESLNTRGMVEIYSSESILCGIQVGTFENDWVEVLFLHNLLCIWRVKYVLSLTCGWGPPHSVAYTSPWGVYFVL